MFPTLHIARRLGRWLLFLLTYDLSVMLLADRLRLPTWTAGNEVTAILGFALGVLVVFRNNAAYDRWWEGRKLWGQLINELRNLALKARAHAALDESQRRAFAQLLAAFANALRLRLRGEKTLPTFPGLPHSPTMLSHGPGYVAGLIHNTLNDWNRRGCLAGTIWILDWHARALMDVCGACERIQTTPLAASYRALTFYGTLLYVVVSPWAVAIDFGWSGLPVILIGSAFLLGVELTAAAVEDPFGAEGDDLPLDSYCRSIEDFVHTVLVDAGELQSREGRS
jgi:putative membrane protein